MLLGETVPTIDTERLRLRRHRLDDFESCVAMWADPVVTRFIGGKPSTKPQTWARMCAYGGHWALMGFGYWAIEERESGAFAGEIGFADFKRDIAPSMQKVPELGFALGSGMHGKGYATEAVRAALSWGDEHLRSSRTVALINMTNAASLRVVEKCGYEIFERTQFNGDAVAFVTRSAVRP